MQLDSHGSARAKTMRLVLASVTVLAFHAVTTLAAASPIESLEFTSSARGHVLVPVSINGSEPLVFALDTAAGTTFVTPHVVETLNLLENPSRSAQTLGVHGNTTNATVELRSVSVGEASANELEAIVLDLAHITGGAWRLDGILGMDFLKKYDLRLDFVAGKLGFYPAADDRAHCAACPPGSEGIAFETIEPGFIVLPASVSNQPVSALLDTGSGHSGLNSLAAESLGVTLPPLPAGTPAGHGFGLQTGPVKLGASTLQDHPTLRVMDHPIMESLGLADRPSMLMGTDQLAGRILTISYGLGEIFLQ